MDAAETGETAHGWSRSGGFTRQPKKGGIDPAIIIIIFNGPRSGSTGWENLNDGISKISS